MNPATGAFTCVSLSGNDDDVLTDVDRVVAAVRAEADAGGAAETSAVFNLLSSSSSAPGGDVVITSGDFGDASLGQTVGYPGFIYLESFVSQPLARVAVSGVSLDEAVFEVASGPSDDLVYVDELGNILAYRTEAEDVWQLCGDAGCSVRGDDSHIKHEFFFHIFSQRNVLPDF